jgi:hypothetical protein
MKANFISVVLAEFVIIMLYVLYYSLYLVQFIFRAVRIEPVFILKP